MNEQQFPSDDRISALADDALAGGDRVQAVQCVLASRRGMQTWHTYHVIGDVLRSAELAPQGDDAQFWERLSQKIALEPRRPALGGVIGSSATVESPLRSGAISSANANVWRWKWVAALAVVALGGVLGAGLWKSVSPVSEMASVDTKVPGVAVVEGSNGVMLRDPYLDSLMAAHQQMAGHSALPAPAGFLRNATYEGGVR